MGEKALFTSADEILGNTNYLNAATPALCLGSITGGTYGGQGTPLGNGRFWAAGWNLSVYTVTTTMPPNRPSCKYYTNVTSRHAGGAQVLMADGAVRFISESINCGNPDAMPPHLPTLQVPTVSGGHWGQRAVLR